MKRCGNPYRSQSEPRGMENRAKLLKPWSGRRDSNPRRPAWEAGILPLNYSRFLTILTLTSFYATYALRMLSIPSILSVKSTCSEPFVDSKSDSIRARESSRENLWRPEQHSRTTEVYHTVCCDGQYGDAHGRACALRAAYDGRVTIRTMFSSTQMQRPTLAIERTLNTQTA